MDFQHILDNIFITLNECRMHPTATARKMQDLQNQFQGRIYKNRFKTREGTEALNDLIKDFSNRKTIDKRLKWSFALHLAADQQANILGERGLVTTETTSNFKSLPNRVEEYAVVRGRLCEVYEFGGRTAEQILQELLIDDGLVSRKRRNTLMDPIFNYIGIGTSYHEKYQACTVIILAEDIISLVAPDTNGRYKKRKGLKTGEQITVKLYENVVMDKAFLGLLGGNQTKQINDHRRNSSQNRVDQASYILANKNTNHQIQPRNEPRFLLDESSIQPRSQNQRITNQSRNTFDDQAYLERQRDRSESQSVHSNRINNTITYQDGGIEYNRDHRLTDTETRQTKLMDGSTRERNDIIIRDTTTSNQVPDPVAPSSNAKKDSKCSLM